MKRTRIVTVGLILASLLIAPGCASKSAERKTARIGQDYEYVYITGSNLRIKVRKGERAVYRGSNAVGTMDTGQVHDAFQVPQGVVNPGN
jgi:hypothetical protein